ncbi:unnamed protein product, partial [Medioppia subpectinata]
TANNSVVSTQDIKTITSGELSGDSTLKAATVIDIDDDLNMARVVPIESVETGVARAVTITEDDVASAKCTVSSTPQLLDEDNDSVFDKRFDEMGKNFWETSYGKFKFTIEELPPQEQLVYVFLKEVSAHNDADVLYHLLYCVKLMSLHSEVLNKAAKNNKGFVIWCQENLLIPNLWKLLQSEFSQISQLCVPLILHCITLPSGTTMFSKVVEEDFHNNDWRARFAAVERVTTIAHFVEPVTVKNSPLLQGSLATAFCYLVHCLDDIEANVAQRALLNLEMIKTSSLKLLLWCLEVQFDLTFSFVGLYTDGQYIEDDGRFEPNWSSAANCWFTLFTGFTLFLIAFIQMSRKFILLYKGVDSTFLSAFMDTVLSILATILVVSDAVIVTKGFSVWCQSVEQSCETAASVMVIGVNSGIDPKGFFLELGSVQFGIWFLLVCWVFSLVLASRKLFIYHERENMIVSMTRERQRHIGNDYTHIVT